MFLFFPFSSYKPTDGLICTYDQHEDSVYAVEWSPADTWTFASLSYAGRIIINQVPTGEKFKILGV
jgi:WD40 repeat protein